MTNKSRTEKWELANLTEMKVMIEEGFDVNLKDDEGDTALLREAYLGHNREVKLLIDAGADIYIEDCDGKDAYITAIEEGYYDVAEIIEKAAFSDVD